MKDEIEWSPPHAHEPNPEPPSTDPAIVLFAKEDVTRLTPDDLRAMPQQAVADCYIVSTGHGTSGPFTFSGLPLLALIRNYFKDGWSAVDVISADGFRTRLSSEELHEELDQPALLALMIDSKALSRAEGLVRLIVPGETDDALRQVKWVSEIRILP